MAAAKLLTVEFFNDSVNFMLDRQPFDRKIASNRQVDELNYHCDVHQRHLPASDQ